MKKELSQLLNIDLETINVLFDNYLIDHRSAARFLIVKDFEAIKEKEPNRSNSDIFCDLAIKHRVSESAIYKWVKLYL